MTAPTITRDDRERAARAIFETPDSPRVRNWIETGDASNDANLRLLAESVAREFAALRERAERAEREQDLLHRSVTLTERAVREERQRAAGLEAALRKVAHAHGCPPETPEDWWNGVLAEAAREPNDKPTNLQTDDVLRRRERDALAAVSAALSASAPEAAPVEWVPLSERAFDFSEDENGNVHIRWHGENTPVRADSYRQMRARLAASIGWIDRLRAAEAAAGISVQKGGA